MQEISNSVKNNKLFDDYAKRTIATYSWPFPLYIYSEDFDGSRLIEMESLTPKTIKVRNIFELDLECRKFVDRNSYRDVDNYIYDGVRFCYKPFSLSHFIYFYLLQNLSTYKKCHINKNPKQN